MNTQNNLQIVQNLYAAFGQGDLTAILDLLAEDIDWFFNGRAADVPFAGQFSGHARMIEFFTTVGQTCEVQEFGPHEMMAFEDKVLCLGHERVQVRKTGKLFETEWAHLFTIHGGKIVRLREYYDTATMAKAFAD